MVTETDIAKRLFTQPPKWGWEYVRPDPADLASLGPRPQRRELPPPAVTRSKARLDAYLVKMVGFCVPAAAALGLAGHLLHYSIMIAAAVGLGVAGLAVVAHPAVAIRRAKRAWAREQHAADARYRRDDARWTSLRDEIEAGARYRRDWAELFFPVGAAGQPARVDVVGGTRVGQAGLFTVFGMSALASGRGLSVVDLTTNDVSGALTIIAAKVGCDVVDLDLPGDLGRCGIFHGLSPDEAASVLAATLDGQLTPGGDNARRMGFEKILHVVTRCLEQPLTLRRMAAGLRILAQASHSDEGDLSGPEQEALLDRVDTIARTERARENLGDVLDAVERLAGEDLDTGGGYPHRWWPPTPGMLHVARTGSRGDGTTKQLLDHLVLRRVHRDVRALGRDGGPAGREGILVVLGADMFAAPTLEELARDAEWAGVRLVYAFEHFRDDVTRLAGSSGSRTIYMRLGVGREAHDAAAQIGQQFVVRLSQLTEQVSQTVTDGLTEATGGQVGRTYGEGYAEGRGAVYSGGFTPDTTNRNRTRSKNWSTALVESWQNARNTSEASGRVDGRTYQVSREFAVAPEALQTMPEHMFLLVGGTGQAPVAGDCNPAIVLFHRVASWPRGTAGPDGAPAVGAPVVGAPVIGATELPDTHGQSAPVPERRELDPPSPHIPQFGGNHADVGWVPVLPDSVRPPAS